MRDEPVRVRSRMSAAEAGTHQLEVAVDLTMLERVDFQLDFVEALVEWAPGSVGFTVLTNRGTHFKGCFEAGNMRTVPIDVRTRPVEVLLSRVDARLPGQSRRKRLARRLRVPHDRSQSLHDGNGDR